MSIIRKRRKLTQNKAKPITNEKQNANTAS